MTIVELTENVTDPLTGQPVELTLIFKANVSRDIDPSDPEVRHLSQAEDRYEVTDLECESAASDFCDVPVKMLKEYCEEWSDICERAEQAMIEEAAQ